MTPAFAQDGVTIYHGDCLDVLRELPAESVHCCVTSPPYWGLRDYGTAEWEGGDGGCDHVERNNDNKGNTTQSHVGRHKSCPRGCGAKRIDSQLGLEATPDEFVANMVEVFREVRRVLRDDGTLWLNLGDSYAGGTGGGGWQSGKGKDTAAWAGKSFIEGNTIRRSSTAVGGLKPKDLCGIPWRVAFALQADGWYLRQDIIWSKPNPMPESVSDRCTKAHEYVFLLSKSPRYFYDADAVRENTDSEPDIRLRASTFNKQGLVGGHHNGAEMITTIGRNRRSVWTIATQPYPGAHFATFPTALVEPCIMAGTSQEGCCGQCGAGLVRVVERRKPPLEKYTATSKPQEIVPCQGGGGMGQKLQNWYNANPTTTTGWQPTCSCNADTVPCTVLDPFLGSGTTAAVAQANGCNCIGIELSEEYLELAKRRFTQRRLFV